MEWKLWEIWRSSSMSLKGNPNIADLAAASEDLYYAWKPCMDLYNTRKS